MKRVRGQTFVLWALTMLFLSVMVLVTLGIATRVRDRTELQMVADAAAYSQAVTVARAFNAISVMNRSSVAATVAAAGTQAQISYSGVLLAVLQMKCPTETPDKTSFPQTKYWQADEAAANQMARLMGVAGSLYTAGVNIYSNTITDHLLEQRLTRRIAQAANKDLHAPKKGAAKSLVEVNGGDHVVTRQEISKKSAAKDASVFNCSGPVCLVGDSTEKLNATMGSIGWTWVRNRSAGGGLTEGSAGFGAASMEKATSNPAFGSTSQMHTMDYDGVNGRNVWAHDHGNSILPPCPGIDASDPDNWVSTGDAWVMSNDDTPGSDYRTDQHVIPMVQGSGHSNQEGSGGEKDRTYEKHTLGSCSWCPGVFPSTISWDIASGEKVPKNDYLQPKLYSIVERDLTTRKDPWNLFFKIKINNSSSGTTFDNGEGYKHQRTVNKLTAEVKKVMRTQVALSAGIVYYHRQIGGPDGDAGWREPPNFLNPFWRATLTSVEGTPDDRPVESLQDAGYDEHAAVLKMLNKNGFRGAGKP